MFSDDFAGKIFAFASEAARIFSLIAAQRRVLGRPINHADAQIAAIARARNANLATRNVVDFVECDIDIVDPWNAL
jgi:toxin FitB